VITVTADAKIKTAGEVDPPLTYQITSGSLAFSDGFSGALSRDPGEEAGAYAIRQGTLALDSNYELTYIGADLTILPASVNTAPTANPGGPYLGAINTAIAFDGSLSSTRRRSPDLRLGLRRRQHGHRRHANPQLYCNGHLRRLSDGQRRLGGLHPRLHDSGGL
jgi:hypothetical protein